MMIKAKRVELHDMFERQERENIPTIRDREIIKVLDNCGVVQIEEKSGHIFKALVVIENNLIEAPIC